MFSLTRLRFSLFFVTLGFPLLTLPIRAFPLPDSSTSFIAQRPNRRPIVFSPRKGQVAPRYNLGGGRRSGEAICQQDRTAAASTSPSSVTQRLTPLMPKEAKEVPLTLSARPTWLIYVPSTSAKLAEFTLYSRQNGRDQRVYRITQPIPDSPGILRFTPPPDAPELNLNEDYRWVMAIACKGQRVLPGDPYVEQLIRRIEPDSVLAKQLDKATGLDRVEVYARSGIWYDLIAELAALRQAKPTDSNILTGWKEVLGAAGLGDITDVGVRN